MDDTRRGAIRHEDTQARRYGESVRQKRADTQAIKVLHNDEVDNTALFPTDPMVQLLTQRIAWYKEALAKGVKKKQCGDVRVLRSWPRSCLKHIVLSHRAASKLAVRVILISVAC